MKRTFILFFIITSFNLFSQNEYFGKVFFRNDSIEIGYYKWVHSWGTKANPKIKFRKFKEEKYKRFSHRDIKKIIEYITYRDTGRKDSIEYHYKNCNFKICLIKKVNFKDKEIKLDLYEEQNSSKMSLESSSFEFSKSSYFIAKNNDDDLQKLPRKKTSKRFEKILTKYTNDCDSFLKQFNKNYFKSKSVYDIVKDYNTICK